MTSVKHHTYELSVYILCCLIGLDITKELKVKFRQAKTKMEFTHFNTIT